MSTFVQYAETSRNAWCKLKITRPVVTWRSEEGDSYLSQSTARLPSGLTRKEINSIGRSLAQELSTHCKHSYDCCGHWYRSVRVIIVSKRRLTIKYSNYQNI